MSPGESLVTGWRQRWGRRPPATAPSGIAVASDLLAYGLYSWLRGRIFHAAKRIEYARRIPRIVQCHAGCEADRFGAAAEDLAHRCYPFHCRFETATARVTGNLYNLLGNGTIHDHSAPAADKRYWTAVSCISKVSAISATLRPRRWRRTTAAVRSSASRLAPPVRNSISRTLRRPRSTIFISLRACSPAAPGDRDSRINWFRAATLFSCSDVSGPATTTPPILGKGSGSSSVFGWFNPRSAKSASRKTSAHSLKPFSRASLSSRRSTLPFGGTRVS